MQKHVNLLDLVKSFPTNIFLQNLASVQKRTNPIKFGNLAEKSEYSCASHSPDPAGTNSEAQEGSAIFSFFSLR